MRTLDTWFSVAREDQCARKSNESANTDRARYSATSGRAVVREMRQRARRSVNMTGARAAQAQSEFSSIARANCATNPRSTEQRHWLRIGTRAMPKDEAFFVISILDIEVVV